MALLYSDGFDGYNGSIAAFLRAGYSQGAMDFGVGSGAGRFGGTALVSTANFSSTGAPVIFSIPQPAVNDIAFAMWIKNLNFSWGDSNYIIRFTNPTSNIGWSVGLDSSGRIIASNLSPTLTAASDMRQNNTGVVINTQDGAWHHIEGRFIASNTNTGMIKIWVDGALTLNYENVITINAQSSYANSVNATIFNGIYVTMTNYCFGCRATSLFDDIVIWDGSGPEMNTASRMGPHRIRSLWPRANGTYRDFRGVANTGGNWNSLISINDDTSYTEANTNQAKDSYLFDIIPGNPSKIPAVMIRSHARNTDIGDKKYSIFVKSGATEVNANSTLYTASPFGYTFSSNVSNTLVYYSNPNGGTQWTANNLANVEIGIEVEN